MNILLLQEQETVNVILGKSITPLLMPAKQDNIDIIGVDCKLNGGVAFRSIADMYYGDKSAYEDNPIRVVPYIRFMSSGIEADLRTLLNAASSVLTDTIIVIITGAQRDSLETIETFWSSWDKSSAINDAITTIIFVTFAVQAGQENRLYHKMVEEASARLPFVFQSYVFFEKPRGKQLNEIDNRKDILFGFSFLRDFFDVENRRKKDHLIWSLDDLSNIVSYVDLDVPAVEDEPIDPSQIEVMKIVMAPVYLRTEPRISADAIEILDKRSVGQSLRITGITIDGFYKWGQIVDNGLWVMLSKKDKIYIN